MRGRCSPRPAGCRSASPRSPCARPRCCGGSSSWTRAFSGVLAFTAPEALHLAEAGFEDIVVAYPTVDRGAIAKVARLTAEDPARAPVLMVDDRPHLDLIEGSIGGGPCARARLPRRRRRLVAAWRADGADRTEALAGARAAPGGADGRRDRRAAGNRARRGDGLRGADRRRRRRRGRPPAAKRRDPRHAGAHPSAIFAAACPTSSTRSRRARRTRRRRSFGSSTAAAPAASRAPPPRVWLPSSPPALASTPPLSSTPTDRSTSLPPRCSACRSCAGRSAASRRCSAAATSRRARPRRAAFPSPTSRVGCASTARRAPARCRRRSRAPPRTGFAIGDRVYLRHAKAGELCERFDSLYLVEDERDRRPRPDLPRRGSHVSLDWARLAVEVADRRAPGAASGRPPRCP